MENTTHKTFKVILVGDGAVGKTSWIRKIKFGKDTKKYIPTIYVNVYDITFKTSKGNIAVKIWDTAGQEKYGGLRDCYYIKADAAIFFADCSGKQTFKSLFSWHKEVARVVGSPATEEDGTKLKIPGVVVGNKSDLKNIPTSKQTTPEDMALFNISVKKNIDILKPIHEILKKLLADENLKIFE